MNIIRTQVAKDYKRIRFFIRKKKSFFTEFRLVWMLFSVFSCKSNWNLCLWLLGIRLLIKQKAIQTQYRKKPNILILPFFVLFSAENCQGIYINVLSWQSLRQHDWFLQLRCQTHVTLTHGVSRSIILVALISSCLAEAKYAV